jgi:hypothetical protein
MRAKIGTLSSSVIGMIVDLKIIGRIQGALWKLIGNNKEKRRSITPQ